MIASLVNNDEKQESYLVIAIQPDNLERMRKADPITLESKSMGGILPEVKYPARLAVLIAYEEDEVELWKLGQAGNLWPMIQYLTRGYHFNRDEDGTDRAFSISKNQAGEK